MEFVESKCPKCNGELRLPKNFEKILCMYCGEELTPQTLGWDKGKYSFTENYEYTMEHISEIVMNYKGIMDSFKKNLYADAMKDYTEETRPIFEAMDRAYTASSINRDKILKECADTIIATVQKDIDNNKDLTNKKKRNLQIENYKIILALYTIPMLGLQKTESAEAFSDVLVNYWIEQYPNMAFQKGTYEDINGGFRKSRFCYITTAVCETLNKPDDCYELTMFRQFRDNYMLQQPMGEALVQEYYEFAPSIVNHINQRSDRRQVYEEIWKKDLAVCLQNIEMGNPEACMKQYMNMVRKLQDKYIQ